MVRFVKGDVDRLFVSGSLEDLLPADSVARRIWEALSSLDFSVFEASYCNDASGRCAVDPRRLAAVWIVWLLRHASSGPKLAERCAKDVEFRWLLGDVRVEKSTLLAFRKNMRAALNDLSAQVLSGLGRAGLLPGESAAVDGTVVRAASSCGASKSRKQLEKRRERLRTVIEQRFERAEEDEGGAEVKEKLRVERALRELDALGLTGPEDRITVTEPEASRKKLKDGGYAPAYNVQAVVDVCSGALLHVEVVDQGNDSGLLKPQVDKANAALQALRERDAGAGAAPITCVVADAGYHDTRQLAQLEDEGITAYVPNDRNENRTPPGVGEAFRAEQFTYDPHSDTMTCPAGNALTRRKWNANETAVTYQAAARDCASCPYKQKCCPKSKAGRSVNRCVYQDVLDRAAARVASDEGRAKAAQRRTTVEGAFARLKDLLHWRRCSAWGKAGAEAELLWRQIAHNLMLLTGAWQPLIHPSALTT